MAVLTDGTATINGADRRWSTVGLYRLEDGQVAECWLLPLDQAEFDDIWTPRRLSRPGIGERPAPVGGAAGDQHPAGDLAVALPERDLAREVRIVRRRLDVAVDVERPRRDRCSPAAGLPQSQRPEPPGEPLRPCGRRAGGRQRGRIHGPSSIRTSTSAIGAPQAAPMIA